MSTKCPKSVEKMSKKCSKNVQKLSGGAVNTIFGDFLDSFCLSGRCSCLVTLSNARPLQVKSMPEDKKLHAPGSGFFFATDLAISVRLASVSISLASA